MSYFDYSTLKQEIECYLLDSYPGYIISNTYISDLIDCIVDNFEEPIQSFIDDFIVEYEPPLQEECKINQDELIQVFHKLSPSAMIKMVNLYQNVLGLNKYNIDYNEDEKCFVFENKDGSKVTKIEVGLSE